MEKFRLIIISVLVLLMPIGIIPLYAQEAESGEEVDVSEIIFGHVGDSYEWHITSWKDKSIAIHLPVIVHSREIKPTVRSITSTDAPGVRPAVCAVQHLRMVFIVENSILFHDIGRFC